MCKPKVVIDNAFISHGWDWSLTGHGFYVVGSNKKMHSTYDASENRRENMFPFGKGDVIKLEYDSKRCILMFQKGGEKRELKVEPAKGEKYRAMGLLYSVGDSIKIRKWQQ